MMRFGVFLLKYSVDEGVKNFDLCWSRPWSILTRSIYSNNLFMFIRHFYSHILARATRKKHENRKKYIRDHDVSTTRVYASNDTLFLAAIDAISLPALRFYSADCILESLAAMLMVQFTFFPDMKSCHFCCTRAIFAIYLRKLKDFMRLPCDTWNATRTSALRT